MMMRVHPTQQTLIYQPAIAWKITSEGLMLQVEVPGIQAEDLDIEATEKTLTVQWTRRPHPGSVALYSEVKYGQFRRSVALPFEIECDRIQSQLKHGILTLNLPKKQKPQPLKITLGKSTPSQTQPTPLQTPVSLEEDPWAA
ncbi:Hsp20/alpha crystallin family protein [Roseofilum sp. BLCC_M154]|uniref:Hsp20/alpha crystallin family protein n=1 Tax=Roseofilum acuticapitatum BLCC-M154 TaxID=3022444 RepID=A0ABT7AMA7_9CYAN|nr:Hsp20/alpha crystallin family protein [Roseofilum acuticapitatum]MDJ1168033.1 Hsp20/alpha crystallin family protein [Roseofilum acuticapitatum BLCC-M154]